MGHQHLVAGRTGAQQRGERGTGAARRHNHLFSRRREVIHARNPCRDRRAERKYPVAGSIALAFVGKRVFGRAHDVVRRWEVWLAELEVHDLLAPVDPTAEREQGVGQLWARQWWRRW